MISTIVGIVSAIVVGLPIALVLRPALSPRTALAAGQLLGLGLIALALMILSLAGVPWSLPAVGAVVLPLAAVAFWMPQRHQRSHSAKSEERGAKSKESLFAFSLLAPRSSIAAATPLIALALEALAYLPILGYARWASAEPPWQGDFWSIWGLKARVFLENRGFDWQFLEAADNVFTHPDYPPLFPLILDSFSLIEGAWTELAVAPLLVALAIAVLLIVRDRARSDFGSPIVAAVVTVAIANLAVTKWVGLADSVMLAFATGGVLLLREALNTQDHRLALLGSILLGCGAMTKNEGIALVLAAAVGTAIYQVRKAILLWPAILLASLWPLIKLPHRIHVDLAEGNLWERAADRLRHPEVWTGVGDFLWPYEEQIWIAAAVAVAVAGSRFLKGERFLVTTLVIQVLLCLGAYLVTPRDLRWHVATSWQRVSAQMTVLVAYTGLLAGAEAIGLRNAFARIRRDPGPEETAA